MDSVLVGQFRFTAAEFRTALAWHYRVRRRRARLILNLVYAGFGLFSAVALWQSGPDDRVLPIAGVAASLTYFGYWFLIRPLRMRSLADRMFGQMSARDQMVRCELSSEGLSFSEPSSSGKMLWGALHEIVRTPDGLLLYPNEHMFQWLPSHTFDQATWKAVIELAKARVERFSQPAM